MFSDQCNTNLWEKTEYIAIKAKFKTSVQMEKLWIAFTAILYNTACCNQRK